MKYEAITLPILLAALAGLAGCDGKGTSNTTSASAAAPSSSTPVAEFKCPEGSAGKGTTGSPCKAKGQARLFDVKWTGKYDKQGRPLFNVKNLTDLQPNGLSAQAYFYDASGKQLDTATYDGKSTRKYWFSSGSIFMNGLPKPSEAKENVVFVSLKPEQVPAGTANIEADVHHVLFKGPDPANSSAWENPDLRPEARPQAAPPPAGAEPAPPTAGAPLGAASASASAAASARAPAASASGKRP